MEEVLLVLLLADDGRTAVERVKGRKFRREVCEFGEWVWYLKPGYKGTHKWEERWADVYGWESEKSQVK